MQFKHTKPKVSIVIPSWFTPDQHGQSGKHETFWFAAECMNSLLKTLKHDRDMYEIILIDNGSTLRRTDIMSCIYGDKSFPAWNHLDSDATIASRFDPEVYWNSADILIKNRENLGFAPSCNQGFALSRGEFVACLNNDILLWDGWAEAMMDPFKEDYKDLNVGVVMPALVKDSPSPFMAIEMNRKDLDLKNNYDSLGKGAEFGSLWMARKSTLDLIASRRDGYQVFDENFELGMGEDRWLWQEIRKIGLETYRTHKTRVYHRGNMTIGKVANRKIFTEKNRKYLEELKKTL